MLADKRMDGLTPSEQLDRAAEVVMEHSNLPDLLSAMDGFPSKPVVAEPLECDVMDAAKASLEEWTLSDWISQVAPVEWD